MCPSESSKAALRGLASFAYRALSHFRNLSILLRGWTFHMSAKNKTKGFTLVELVVVVVIIGILAAVAAPRFLNKTDAAKAQVTLQKAAAMRNAIEIYRADNGSYPTAANLDANLEAYIRGGVPTVDYKTLTGSTVHGITGADPTTLPSGVTSTTPWIYNATTGSVFVNDGDLFDGKYDGT